MNNIIVYDGVCVFCNFWVKLLLKIDKKKKFHFTSLQSQYFKVLSNHRELPKETDSVMLITKECVFVKSDVVTEVSKLLGFPYSVFYLLKIIPKFIRDYIYDLVAANRYKIFGKYDNCPVPSHEEISRFLQ